MPFNHTTSWKIYAISICVVVATVIDFFLYPYLRASNLIMVYLLSVTIVALFGKTGPSVIASLFSVLAYDFFFISTHFGFVISDIQDFFTLAVMFVIAQVSRQLASTRGVNRLLDITVRYLADLFDSEIMALLPENNHLTLRAKYGTEGSLNDKEYSVAQWVYELGQPAGLGTDTLPFSRALYVPLPASQKTMGVPEHLFTPEQMHLLEDCAHQIALALEVELLHEHYAK